MKKYLISFLIAATTLASPVQGEEIERHITPRLRPNVIINTAIVTVGDLFDNAGKAETIPVFQSPDPGTIGHISRKTLITALKAAGVRHYDLSDIKTLSVHRTGQIIHQDMVMQSLNKHIAQHMGVENSANINIILNNTIEPHIVAKNIEQPFKIEHLDYHPHSGLFRAQLHYFDGQHTRRMITGRAVKLVEVMRLANPLERGAIIQRKDLIIAREPEQRSHNNKQLDMAFIIGQAAVRRLRSGHIITQRDFGKPLIIEKDQLVTLIYQLPGLTLTVRGKALNNATKGDIVNVTNPRSKRIIEGEAIRHGTVLVRGQYHMAELGRTTQ